MKPVRKSPARFPTVTTNALVTLAFAGSNTPADQLAIECRRQCDRLRYCSTLNPPGQRTGLGKPPRNDASSVQVLQAGNNEMDMKSDNDISVNLELGAAGNELVVCNMGVRQIKLSPHQARTLASKLILAVNRAEVRINLKQSHKLSRKLES
jgi:hypothetical protein